MKTLCTQEYRQALEEFVENSTMPSLPFLPSFSPFEMRCTDLDIEKLALFLEHIAILRHPVYRYSPKLISIALELRHTEIHETNVEQLTQYLQNNDTLHLEGYITFRMADYHNKLDMMTYCIIKRLQIHSPPQ